jgi:hypothetical protein
MREEEFSARLRSGAVGVGGSVNPPPAVAIRDRGNRRRRRQAVMSGVLAFVIGAGGGGGAYASFDRPATGTPSLGPSQYAPAAAQTAGSGRPRIVAVTTGGALELLDPVTGMASAILAPDEDAIGDEVAVSPGGSTVYFAVRHGCTDDIESIPVTGGTPEVITTGVLPSISPDGTELAFVREPVSSGPVSVSYGCASASPGAYTVVIRNLATRAERTYSSADDLALPVSHLSWAPDGKSLLISAGPAQGTVGWVLATLNPARSSRYLPAGLLASPAADGTAEVPSARVNGGAESYDREGVYLPDGDIFADRVCCTGTPAGSMSNLLLEIAPSGREVRQVAIGFANTDHSSLDATRGWLLYLSANDLFISATGKPPYMLTSGLIAAAWL